MCFVSTARLNYRTLCIPRTHSDIRTCRSQRIGLQASSMACSSVKVFTLRTVLVAVVSGCDAGKRGSDSGSWNAAWQRVKADLLVRGVLYLMLMSLFSRCLSMASCRRLRPCMKGGIDMGSPVTRHEESEDGGRSAESNMNGVRDGSVLRIL